ncbi:hypothetical protein O3Q27_04170 [Enterococcus lactis]
MPKKISLTQKQLDRADRLSGHWFIMKKILDSISRLQSDQISKGRRRNKEEGNNLIASAIENENGKISIYGTTDKGVPISEVDTDTVYIGGGMPDIESAWRD